MEDQTDVNGVPEDPETADPSQNPEAPEPLLGEEPRSGALSAIPAPGTKADTQSRLEQSRAKMGALQAQYGNDTQLLSDAYANQKKTLQDATQRLLTMQMGPTDQEAAYRTAAAFGTGDTGGRFSPVGYNATQAQILQERREAETQRNQLLAQYAGQVSQAQIGQAGANINRDIQMSRIGQSDLNAASSQADKIVNAPQKAVGTTVWDPAGGPQGTGAYVSNDALVQAQQAKAATQLKNQIALKQAVVKINQGQLDDNTLNLVADQYNITHQLPAGVARASLLTPILQRAAERATANGDTAGSLIADGQMTKNAQGVLTDFTKGKTAQALNGLNTSIAHTSILEPLIANLNNTQAPMFNAAYNAAVSAFGGAAPSNFNTARDFVAGEISKAVLPGGGGERERESIAAAVKNSNSPEQLTQAVALWKQLLAGKTEATRNQWDTGTQGRFGAFDQFLLPTTKAAIGYKPTQPAQPPQRPGQQPQAQPPTPQTQPPRAPALTNQQGWPLHKDKNGNMAYVSPDGKQVQMVQ